MAGLLYESFDYFATAQLPALWDSAVGVTIDETGGRFGGGCAVFDASLDPSMVRALTWHGSGPDCFAYLGFAVKAPITGFEGVTLAKLTSDSGQVFTVRLSAERQIVLSHSNDDGFEPIVTPFRAVPLNRGSYVEVGIQLGSDRPASIRVNGETLARGFVADAGAFVSLTLGGGTGETGTWRIDDIYLCDGEPQEPIAMGGVLIENAGFLGNVHVQALFPTHDAYNIDFPTPTYTPWTPDPGPLHYTMVNAHPPTDTTNESSINVGTYDPVQESLDIYASYEYKTPYQTNDEEGFGQFPGGFGYWPILAVQWIGRMLSASSSIVKPTIRDTEGGTGSPASDFEAMIGDPITLTSDYVYHGSIFDRDPYHGVPRAWTMQLAFVFPDLDAQPQSYREFGVTLDS